MPRSDPSVLDAPYRGAIAQRGNSRSALPDFWEKRSSLEARWCLWWHSSMQRAVQNTNANAPGNRSTTRHNDPGPGRFAHWRREIPLQRLMETSMLVRINRGLRSHTTVPGKVHDHKPGDMIDVHRPPSNKDTSGWHGPARVIVNVPRRDKFTHHTTIRT